MARHGWLGGLAGKDPNTKFNIEHIEWLPRFIYNVSEARISLRLEKCKQSCEKGHGAARLACRPCWKRSKCWLSSFQDSSYSSCVDGRHKCHVPSSTHRMLQAKEMGVISVFQQVLCTFSKCPSSPDNIWTLKGEEEEVSDGRRFSAIKRFYFCCKAV